MFNIITKKVSILFSVLFCVSLVLVPTGTRAAVLYLEPYQGQYQPGDTFIVEIKLDTEKESINVVEANLSFPRDILEVKDFSSGNSILTLWIKDPSFSNQEGKISFIGGVPGSYLGNDGLLARIIVRAHETDTKLERETDAKIRFLDSSKVLLSDKKGTEAILNTEGAVFKILSKISEVTKNEWQEELQKDKIPPEPFKIEIGLNSSLFDGKYFITFSAVDKQTGIDYYEVKESKREWEVAKSPCLLENQSLGEEIKVKAVDKAGNKRIQMIKPGKIGIEKKISWKNILPWIILVLVGIWVAWRIINKLRNK